MRRKYGIVIVIFVSMLLLAGCGKDETSDEQKIGDAINGEYADYFNISAAFAADDASLMRVASPTEYDSVYDWRYPPGGRSISRDFSVSVSGDVATITINRTLSATAIFRCWEGESLVSYNRALTACGARTARFVRDGDGNWHLDAISPIQMTTTPSTVDIDSIVATNLTSGERFIISDPTHLYPLDSIFTIAPEDMVDVFAYTGSDAAIIFRHPRHATYERAFMMGQGEQTYRYQIRTDATTGVRHFIVDAVTIASAIDSSIAHDGEIWAMCFRVE